jgi:hypothetical protein
MGLLDKMLNQAVTPPAGPRKAIFRLLLDDKGQIQDVVIKRSSGDHEADLRGMVEIRQMRFPAGRLGGGPKTSRRWHELAYTIEP